MTRLSVNINKVALLRNARGGHLPDLIQVAKDCETFGAQGITVHPRPDERHIRYDDLRPLSEVVKTEFNIEGYPSSKFLDKVLNVKPHQCTLVPDPPGVLTSDSGWDTKKQLPLLKDVVARLKEGGIRVSLFLDPQPGMVDGAKEAGADRIELYTGDYARNFHADKRAALGKHVECAKLAQDEGLEVNAGHDLNLENLHYYIDQVPAVAEVSIGHALICDALYYGLKNTIQLYLERLKSE